jgi:hypothetical protein
MKEFILLDKSCDLIPSILVKIINENLEKIELLRNNSIYSADQLLFEIDIENEDVKLVDISIVENIEQRENFARLNEVVNDDDDFIVDDDDGLLIPVDVFILAPDGYAGTHDYDLDTLDTLGILGIVGGNFDLFDDENELASN